VVKIISVHLPLSPDSRQYPGGPHDAPAGGVIASQNKVEISKARRTGSDQITAADRTKTPCSSSTTTLSGTSWRMSSAIARLGSLPEGERASDVEHISSGPGLESGNRSETLRHLSADLSSPLLSVTKPLAMHSPVQIANLPIFDYHRL
jgi:hypothetical protein